MTKLYRIVLCLFVLVVAGLLGSPSSAAEGRKEKDLGSFGAWRAFAYEDGGQKVCYMLTTKTVPSKGAGRDRKTYLMVTHRPVEASLDVFSYGAGEPLDARRGVELRIDKQSYDLFSAKETAWARDARTDHKIAAALRAGNQVEISAIPSERRVSTINDLFSLAGSTMAYRAISEACGLPNAGAKSRGAASQGVKKPVATKASPQKKTLKAKDAVKKTPAKTTPKKPAKPAPTKKTQTNKTNTKR